MAGMPLTTGTAQPVAGQGGFPPFETHTYPSQVFWLAITFALLLAFLWTVVVPRIGGTISARKGRIADALAEAEHDRREADRTWTTYQNTLVEARAKARMLIEENRHDVRAEVQRAEKGAESQTNEALAKAEAQLAEMRARALAQIRRAAEEAAAAIVSRLIGETVSSEEAAAAVAAINIP
jgi:F-type H+-transporting ATPase subunit b